MGMGEKKLEGGLAFYRIELLSSLSKILDAPFTIGFMHYTM